jgi:hypothetical protein
VAQPKLYDTSSTGRISVQRTAQFLKDINLLMATHKLDVSTIVRESVHAQAEAVRDRVAQRQNAQGEK